MYLVNLIFSAFDNVTYDFVYIIENGLYFGTFSLLVFRFSI